MILFELFTAPEVLPFAVAFATVLGLGVLEGLGLLFSASPTHAVEHSLTHFFPHMDHANHADADSVSVLGWLHFGRVPLLVLLLLFLSAFAVGGYAFQWVVQASSGSFAPLWLATSAAAVEAVAVVRVAGGALAKLIPADESSAVSDASFIGSAATVTSASAQEEDASVASVLDVHGRKHFLLVTPEQGSPALVDGMQATVLAKVGARYVVKPHFLPITQITPP